MTTTLHFVPAAPSGGGPQVPAGALRRALERVIRWIEACSDYYAAAALYEEQSRLSNAELRRRGVSRETLARDACAACDRTSGAY